MPDYVLRARDSDGSFHECRWRTPEVPVVGDEVMLPDDAIWREVPVTGRQLFRDRVEVWVGPVDGVAEIFTRARELHGGLASPSIALCREVLGVLRNSGVPTSPRGIRARLDQGALPSEVEEALAYLVRDLLVEVDDRGRYEYKGGR